MYNLLFQPQFFTAAEIFLQKSIDFLKNMCII